MILFKVSWKFVLGHSTIRQNETFVDSPVQLPPLASSTSLIRVLFWLPGPHVAEQSPSTQSSHSQSTKIQYICFQYMSMYTV